MAYCTLANITDVITEEIVIQLTDDDSAGTVDQDHVDRAIERADELIDSYLRGRYQVPFTIVPGLVNHLSADLSIYYLYDRRLNVEVPASVENRYKKAIEILERLQNGDLVLDSADAGSKPSEYRTNKDADSRDFNKDVFDKY